MRLAEAGARFCHGECPESQALGPNAQACTGDATSLREGMGEKGGRELGGSHFTEGRNGFR